jgi:hypothetical protein
MYRPRKYYQQRHGEHQADKLDSAEAGCCAVEYKGKKNWNILRRESVRFAWQDHIMRFSPAGHAVIPVIAVGSPDSITKRIDSGMFDS